MYEHILVGLDGSKLAEQILPYVELLAARFNSSVTLLRATISLQQAVALGGGMMDGIIDPTLTEEEDRRRAAEYLSQLADGMRRRGLTVKCALPEGPPARAILDHACRGGTDLMALTTHGRGGLERLVFGSVADGVLRKSESPVLVVRATKDV
jgi:nucleotide-binding universal stress UspA family protein